ncbi:MAG: hypothetical protein WBP44_07740 [Gammaproteobacteria bacterium]
MNKAPLVGALSLHQLGEAGQISPTDSRNSMFLTMLSKLVAALVIGIVAAVVLLIG